MKAICAYCAATKTPLQREHPVARAFWDGPRPSRTVTVPACTSCEEHFKAEETYFRNTIVALAGARHPESKALLQNKMARGLARDLTEFADITRGLQHGFRRNPKHGLFEPASRFVLDTSRLNRCVEKVVRGLFYFTRKRPLSPTHEVIVWNGNSFWRDTLATSLIDAMNPFAGYGDGDTVFQARTVKDKDDPGTSAWLLVFYQSIGFFVLTCPVDDSCCSD